MLMRPLRPARDRSRRVEPASDSGGPGSTLARFKDLTWEASNLQSVTRHPTGFGRPRAAPEECLHHGQVGATCGMAAVNNLLTNSGGTAVDAEYMLAISASLGQAEAELREGAQCVEEAGEQQNLAELYAAASGGHFDVQTLQTAFEEAGYSMWYMNPQRLDCSSLFDWAQEPAESSKPTRKKQKKVVQVELQPAPIGYVVHRKDALNSRQDHWFVVRQHGRSPDLCILLQDSLYDQVFELTRVEAQQLLLSLPQGALFAVSRLSSLNTDSTAWAEPAAAGPELPAGP
mmetsp:Transcript_40782/g.108749  ORF Transcript_40782/g.108749 Transcript_40782/m.108749 type:complete len:288 (-) Transcript_40782:55-918(-)